MSLKAKIEAVIYASEEPVTLAQLTGLLGQEAQQELDRIAARQHQLHLAGPDDVPTTAEETATEELIAAVEQPELETVSSELIAESSQIEPLHGARESSEPAPPDEAAEKRIARERDRKLREFLRETVAQLIHDY